MSNSYSPELHNKITQYGDRIARAIYGETEHTADYEVEVLNCKQQENEVDCAPLHLLFMQTACSDKKVITTHQIDTNDLRLAQIYALDTANLQTWSIYESPQKRPTEGEPVDEEQRDRATKTLF